MGQQRFNCVETKGRIQAEMLKELEGLTEEDIRLRIRNGLETSDSPVARRWREFRRHEGDTIAHAEASDR